MSNTLPNLIVLGAMKSGTTSLHDYLNCHPDINMSSPKEIDYFVEEKNYNKGLDWYKKHFNSEFKINGESSQNYSKRHYFKGVSEKIKNTIEECKFIYIVRDPLKRIESHYRENQFDTGVKINLNTIIENNIEHNIVLTSKYYFQLETYLKHYPKENFHVLTLESLNQNFDIEMSKIFKFLEVDDITLEKNIEIKNKSDNKKAVSSFGRLLRNKNFRLFHKLFLPQKLKNRIKKTEAFEKTIKSDLKFETLSPVNKELVYKYLIDDINLLKKEFNLDTSKWIDFNQFAENHI